MVLTESKTLEVGTKAPAFTLPEPLTTNQISLYNLAEGAPALLVMFICNHCPFVVLLKEKIVEVCKEYMDQGVAVVAISSNSIKTHPQDGPQRMADDAKNLGYPFPYLYDETQDVAKQYKAACTPEFYVFDSNRELAYHGQFDDARPGKGLPVTGNDLRAALDDVLAGRPVQRPVKPSIGCNIKWHPR
ncbi:alkyl hydroperoxide reductase/ thiol specific antioxidant/ Mal allergen [Coccomyxa subellipsoidea C-169]|uniref:Alkyl hydroperoxide reductase/ thiol specific antioxidant/ Mal allergen n=1 Tax=Coccomyxa subellipsoidea (strain C-169) TaxID=574566 RepID=I0YVL5_COCSC|nr:alkyl hydroperoxide reductase/ thiol specific antioxidant/ Mal allergen [Coccomyxa subellipsoidea C-169]EIE22434.1 alkyl hydroperoxide reductase/ thiol specific antioxidant/ Mal allergen [Coccomyxa subellipsoidea C-169]|eukprot:XP_005646978.1 alkyl hydroperoxide reductase/ thiol specific antioxidant/ Mal allergen [Coccomyxa subellipsoidea C-169]